MLIWTLTFFPHSCLYLCCFSQNADLCDPDLQPRSPRTKVGFCCGPAGRSLRPSSPGQAPSLLSAAQGPSAWRPVSPAGPLLSPSLGRPRLDPGQTVSLSPGGGASGEVHILSRALARRPPAQTRKQPGLDARAPFPHAQEPPRPPVGPEAQENPPVLLRGPKLRRLPPPPRPPAGPEAQDMKQETWLWPWSG